MIVVTLQQHDSFHSSAFEINLQEKEVLLIDCWLPLDFTMGKEPLIDEHDGT